jgi:hypothetical protein
MKNNWKKKSFLNTERKSPQNWICYCKGILEYLSKDVSLHKVVELGVVISTSPRSSKTESECSSYCRFWFGVSASFRGAEIAGPGPEIARAMRVVASLFRSRFLSGNSFIQS